jgi:hypothetical protein
MDNSILMRYVSHIDDINDKKSASNLKPMVPGGWPKGNAPNMCV